MELAKDREVIEDLDEPNLDISGEDFTEICFHMILGKTSSTTIKDKWTFSPIDIIFSV